MSSETKLPAQNVLKGAEGFREVKQGIYILPAQGMRWRSIRNTRCQTIRTSVDQTGHQVSLTNCQVKTSSA